MGQQKKVKNAKTARLSLLVYLSITVSTFPLLHNLPLRLKDVEIPVSYC